MSDLIATAATLVMGAAGIIMTSRSNTPPQKRVHGGADSHTVRNFQTIEDVAQWQADHPEDLFDKDTDPKVRAYIADLNQLGVVMLVPTVGKAFSYNGAELKQRTKVHLVLSVDRADAVCDALDLVDGIVVARGPEGSTGPCILATLQVDGRRDEEDCLLFIPEDIDAKGKALAIKTDQWSLPYNLENCVRLDVIDTVWCRPYYAFDAVIRTLESLLKPMRKARYVQDACAICLEEIDCHKPGPECLRLKCSKALRHLQTLPASLQGARRMEACSTKDLLKQLHKHSDKNIIMTCGHALHSNCLADYIRQSGTKCPSCQAPIILGGGPSVERTTRITTDREAQDSE